MSERRQIHAHTATGTLDLIEWAQSTPLNGAAIRDAADYVEREGARAWDAIDPLAGMLAPRVRAAVERELDRRASGEANR